MIENSYHSTKDERRKLRRRSRNLMRFAGIGALVAVTVVFGVPILCSRDPSETARLLLFAGEQLVRRRARPLTRHGPSPRSIEAARLLMLQAISGVGPLRARALLAELGSPAEVGAASLERLARVEGIGPLTASSICKVFRDDQRSRQPPPGGHGSPTDAEPDRCP